MRLLNFSECSQISGAYVSLNSISPTWLMINLGAKDTFIYKNNNDVIQINGYESVSINGQPADDKALQTGVFVNNLNISYVDMGHILSEKVYSIHTY